MCEYCKIDERFNRGKQLLEFDGTKSAISIHQFVDERMTIQYDVPHAERYRAIINFCPMCGRKLGGAE